MPKNKKQRLNTAYQKHLNLLKALGIFLLAVSLIATGVISYLLAQEQYTEVLFYIFVAALIAFIAGILISIIASMKQNTADIINENLYAVWKYKPETIYRFYRKQCRYQKKTASINAFLAAAVVFLIGFFMTLNSTAHYLGIVFLVFSGIIFLYAIVLLPYSQYLLLRFRTMLLGDAKEIIFSRSGIWYCGKVCFFGDKNVTYHRVERKDLHGQDAIVFHYTHTIGFQQTAKELCIPVSPKMAYAADSLVEEFNRSDLLKDMQKKE